MNFVADESLDRPIVERLRRDGHTVAYIADTMRALPRCGKTRSGDA